MRIAFVTLGYVPLRTSGFDVSGERVVQALLDDGHQVVVIAAADGLLTETHAHPMLEIHRLPLGRSNWIGYAYRAARKVRELSCIRPFDVVHFWDVHFAYAYRGRYVASLHQSFRQRSRSLGLRGAGACRLAYYYLSRTLAERPSLGRATALLAVSSATRDEFIRSYGVPPDRIVLARHGIDTDFFRPDPGADLLRVRLGLHEDEPVVLFVGFVTPRKGLEYLAQALPLMQPSPRLLIVGRWDEEARAHILNLLGATAGQVIEAGFVPDDQMPTYYSLADVYVSPSLLEGFGLPLCESLACETPVVAARAGAAVEVVGPGGMLVPPRDSHALADAVSHLLADRSLRQALGRQGREHVIREFSMQAMLRAILKGYERLTP